MQLSAGMVSQNYDYDIAIIGGGLSGLGLAISASHWGFKTALFEGGKLGAATSANSLRIIHGGFRYLQTLNLMRVIESIKAQKKLLADYPDLVKPLACIMPLEKRGMKSALPVSMALKMYEGIKKFQGHSSLPPGAVWSAEKVQGAMPEISSLAPGGALCWYDAQLADYGKFVNVLRDRAEKSGAQFFEDAMASSVEQDSHAAYLDFADARQRVSARVVFNAAGPGIANLRGVRIPPLRWARSFNIKLNRHIVKEAAIGLPVGRRLLFFTPRASGTVVGTWYLEASSTQGEIKLTDAEFGSAVGEINEAWPGLAIGCSDIAGIEIGLLPMKASGGSGPVLYGAEKIFCVDRIFNIMSTKLTTFETQAERALVAARKYLQ